MIEDPNDMKNRTHSEISDELQATDRALLLALSSRQRDKTPLSLDHERLIDNWIAGHLPPVEADRAAELTKNNRLAAERVLECRLMKAAKAGPGIPSSLAARILKAAVGSRIDTATHSALTGVSESPKTRTSRIVNWGEPIFGGWNLFRFGQVAAIALMAVSGLPHIERGPAVNLVSDRLGGGAHAVYAFDGGGEAGGVTTLYIALAGALGAFALVELIRTLRYDRADTWKGKGTVTREHHPMRYWCYVLVDSAIFVCCSTLFLLGLHAP